MGCFPKINNPCPKGYPDSKCVVYTGANLVCSGILTNDRLNVILEKIDEKLCQAIPGEIFLEAGANISITGAGTENNPYIISSSFTDTNFVNTNLTASSDRTHNFSNNDLTINGLATLTLRDNTTTSSIEMNGSSVSLRASFIDIATNNVGGNVTLSTTNGVSILINADSTSVAFRKFGITSGVSLTPAYVFHLIDPADSLSEDYTTAYLTNDGGDVNTTGGDVTVTLATFSAETVRSSGANDLINVAIHAMASNGQQNYAGIFDGKFALNLGSDAIGDIYYRDANGDVVRRAIGASDEVLTSNGTIPVWAPISALAATVDQTVFSGDNVTQIFNIPHGLGVTPKFIAMAASDDAQGATFSADSTNLIVTYTVAPPTGTDNITINWIANL